MASFRLIIIIQLLISVLLQRLENAAILPSEAVHTDNDTKLPQDTLHTDNITKLPLDKLRQVFSISRLKNKDYKFITGNGSEIINGLLKVKQHFDVSKLCALLTGARDSTEERRVNTINFSVVQELPNIRELWLLPGHNVADKTKSYITYLELFKEYDVNLSHLSELHLHVPLGSHIDSLTNLLNLVGRNLTVLSLKGILLFNEINDLGTIFKEIIFSRLKALSLSAVRKTPNYNTKLNLPEIFSPGEYSGIEYLDLSYNGIIHIINEFIMILPGLRILDVSHNFLLSPSSVLNAAFFYELVLYHPNIEVMNGQSQNGRFLVDDMSSDVTQLVYNRNTPRIKRSDNNDVMQVFSTCMTLNNVTTNDLLAAKKAVFCEVLICTFTRSQLINPVMRYMIRNIPCYALPSFSDFLTKYIDHTGQCEYGLKLPFAPQLKELNMNSWNPENYMNRIIAYNKDHIANICVQTNMLQNIFLSSSQWLKQGLVSSTVLDYTSVYGFLQMETIDLSFNKLKFSAFNSLFISWPSLIYINLAGNYVTFDKNLSLCKYFRVVQYFDISYCNLSSHDIPQLLVYNSTQLSHLNLAGNGLTYLDLHMLEVPSLELLNVSGNHISKFTDLMVKHIKHYNRKHILTIDLTENDITCGCSDDELSTLDLIQNAAKYNLSFENSNLYTCLYQNSYELITKIDVPNQSKNCKYPHLNLILATTLSNFVIILILSICLTFYKYKGRLSTYSYRIIWHLMTRKSADNRHFAYDAYVIYCDDDRFWVHDNLMKKLEVECGFQLCLGNLRNFTLGNPRVDEIVRHLLASRAVILILSKNSLQNGWVDLERNIAQEQFIKGNCKLLIIKLGDINVVNDMSDYVKYIIWEKMYIEWPEKDSDNGCQFLLNTKAAIQDREAEFWNQLIDFMYDYNQLFCCRRKEKRRKPIQKYISVNDLRHVNDMHCFEVETPDGDAASNSFIQH